MNWTWRISPEEVLSVPENPLLPTAYEPVFKQCLLFGKKALGCFTSNSMGIWPTYRQTPRKIISSHMSQQQLPVVPCLEGQGCGGGGRARDIASSRGAWWGTPPIPHPAGSGGSAGTFHEPPFPTAWLALKGKCISSLHTGQGAVLSLKCRNFKWVVNRPLNDL